MPQVVAPAPFDKQAWLEGELRDGWARCGGLSDRAELGEEILDVSLMQTDDDPRLRACIEQIAWSVELPWRFVSFETWTITL